MYNPRTPHRRSRRRRRRTRCARSLPWWPPSAGGRRPRDRARDGRPDPSPATLAAPGRAPRRGRYSRLPAGRAMAKHRRGPRWSRPPVEELSYVPGTPVDRLGTARRWFAAQHSSLAPWPTAARRLPPWRRRRRCGRHGSTRTTFRRLVQVSGERLAVVLRRVTAGRPPRGHLRLEAPCASRTVGPGPPAVSVGC